MGPGATGTGHRRNPQPVAPQRGRVAHGAPRTAGPRRPRQSVADELAEARAAHTQSAARLAEARSQLASEVDRRRPDRPRVAALKTQIVGLECRLADAELLVDMLGQRQAAADGVGDPGEGLRERHDMLSAAIDLIVDDAMTAAASHPAAHLTAVLGPCPADDLPAAGWDRRARTIEAWRHHHLGRPYGQPAAGPDAPPSQQALARPAE